MKEEMMAKIMEAIAEGKIKAVSIAFEGDEMDKEEAHEAKEEEGEEEESDEMSKEEMKEALRSVENLKKYSKLMK